MPRSDDDAGTASAAAASARHRLLILPLRGNNAPATASSLSIFLSENYGASEVPNTERRWQGIENTSSRSQQKKCTASLTLVA
ncbi:hypothetical protein U9M48_023860 [Paspalum notatum var. saurae]|uniref:Uncharacterized protein n=1 Tax=Paspalum notatum var. saurae TaxID=547442 RepID=A0AAQ3WW38_PASNO